MTESAKVTISTLVPGGQGLGELSGGKKIFVWNALPGEIVEARILKQRASFAEGVAEQIIQPSQDRVVPKEDNFLATSPWQMMTFAAENRHKQAMVHEIYQQQGINVANRITNIHDDHAWRYRNKMEYSFWGDDTGLQLALHRRDSHSKQAVPGSELAMPGIDTVANAVTQVLEHLHVRAGDLKTIIVRSSQTGDIAAALFVKAMTFPEIALPSGIKGLRVYYSNPKSPASVRTKLLREYGNCQLEDQLLGRNFMYDVDAFFQINVPVYEMALSCIRDQCTADDLTDMYAGVGSIGLSVAGSRVSLVESDPASSDMARRNAAASSLRAHVIQSLAEQAVEYITASKPVVFDPPRAGLHAAIIERLLHIQPPQVIYLSCNPATQARDIAMLQQRYVLEYLQGFNFFPRTPHIETLAVLIRKD